MKKKESNKKDSIKANIQVGIESIGAYAPFLFFALKDLAHARSNGDKKVEEDLISKYEKRLGQIYMSIIHPNEDIITMAYEAVSNCLNSERISNDIDLLLFATESAIDNSKSAACELYGLLEHEENNQCRCIELKHACYGGTGALMMAKEHILNNPGKKALVVMSDVAFYGLETKGEPTQGCGAIAILLSSKPKIAVFNNDNVFFTSNKNDFYRPAYQIYPIYDGRNSIASYINMLKKTYNIYKEKNKNYNFDFFISHMPFANILDKCCDAINIDKEKNKNEYIKYIQKYVGNTYTASLYIGLYSLLLTTKPNDLYNKKVMLFSYGSGAECEMFSIKILKNYDEDLPEFVKHYKELIIDLPKKNKENKLHVNTALFDTFHRCIGYEKLEYERYCNLLKNFEKREQSLEWSCLIRKNVLMTRKMLIMEKTENGVRHYRYR